VKFCHETNVDMNGNESHLQYNTPPVSCRLCVFNTREWK